MRLFYQLNRGGRWNKIRFGGFSICLLSGNNQGSLIHILYSSAVEAKIKQDQFTTITINQILKSSSVKCYCDIKILRHKIQFQIPFWALAGSLLPPKSTRVCKSLLWHLITKGGSSTACFWASSRASDCSYKIKGLRQNLSLSRRSG
jgi:hypothetical protein